MKLLLLTQYFPPETGAPQNRLFELAVRLQKMGVEVTVLTAMPNYPAMEVAAPYKGKLYVKEQMDGLEIHRCYIYASKKRNILARLANYFSFVFSSAHYGTYKLGKFDVLLVESPPLFLGFAALWLSWLKHAKMVFNVSDLWPESAVKLDIVTNKYLIGISTWLEELCYKKAALVTGQTMGIVENISGRFPAKKVVWLPNGVDVSFYRPEAYDKKWRIDNGFKSTDILLLYAGIIGIAQGLDVILNAAVLLKQYTDLQFVFVGDGPEKIRLEELKAEKQLHNVHFVGLVSKSQMPTIVAACDATIVPLKKLDLFLGAIPSKIFENLAMEKPVFLGVDGEARKLFIDQGKAGWYFEPENHEQLAALIEAKAIKANELQEAGQNGRAYVTHYFNRDTLAANFYCELNKLIEWPKK